MTSWDELKATCMNCTGCQLHKTRTNVVFGVGNETAEVLFVGEGPGETEDLKGEPFVGRAGILLDDILKIVGLNRSKNIYITNIVKCRPPKNRDPNNAEREICSQWLRAQFALIKPKIVVSLGRIAATELIGADFKITRDHGKWFDKDGIKHIAIYHPSALLRDPYKRPDTFVDMKEIERSIKDICERTL